MNLNINIILREIENLTDPIAIRNYVYRRMISMDYFDFLQDVIIHFNIQIQLVHKLTLYINLHNYIHEHVLVNTYYLQDDIFCKMTAVS